eukprot:Gb_30128 [translate_table: standard]
MPQGLPLGISYGRLWRYYCCFPGFVHCFLLLVGLSGGSSDDLPVRNPTGDDQLKNGMHICIELVPMEILFGVASYQEGASTLQSYFFHDMGRGLHENLTAIIHHKLGEKPGRKIDVMSFPSK